MQTAVNPQPPQILQIFRELLKPGSEAAYGEIEEDTARLSAELECPRPYLGIESLTGSREVWFFNGYESPVEQKRVVEDYTKNAPLLAALEKNSKRKASLIGKPVDVFASFRKDLSRGVPWILGQGRFLVITVTRRRPRRDGTVFESADGTRFIILPAQTRSEADAAAAAGGPDSRVFAVRPSWSFPAKQWIAIDSAFWRPAPRLTQPAAKTDLLARIDHLVYATPDLDLGVDTIEKLTGVRATPGGRHPGLGTRNALISLGPTSYLEIIGPDLELPTPAGERPFGIDALTAPRLSRWVVKAQNLETLAAEAARKSVHLGEVTSGQRQRPDGVLLTWRFTDPRVDLADGLVPFFIDWGQSPHPSATAPDGLALTALRAEHPDAARVEKILSELGLDLHVRTGPAPALIATIDSPRGRVELR